MSVSDAAPLPRLGEVFFDVRGDSRSMRLSWYADTGVAVFSIWQGGRCTGTFRLPIDDLDRMIEILRRGPQRRRQRGRPDSPGPDAYGTEIYSADGYGPGPVGSVPDSDGREGSVHDSYGRDGGPEDYGGEGYGGEGYGPESRGRDGYDNADYRTTQYQVAGYASGRRPGPPADYQPVGHADREYPSGAYWQDEGGHPVDATDEEQFAGSGYGQDRFVPPYVQSPGGSYLNDNPGGGSGRRRGVDPAAYPGADRVPGTDYGLTADPGAATRHSAGRHSSL